MNELHSVRADLHPPLPDYAQVLVDANVSLIAGWYDRYDAGPNLRSKLEGKTVTACGDPEIGQPDETFFVIARVVSATVGLDSRLFLGVGVICADGVEYCLYSDGKLADENDVILGTWSL